MKVRGIIAGVLLTLGFIVLFSAAAIMDGDPSRAGSANWIAGAVRGVIGLAIIVAGGIFANSAEFGSEEEHGDVDISDWRDAS